MNGMYASGVLAPGEHDTGIIGALTSGIASGVRQTIGGAKTLAHGASGNVPTTAPTGAQEPNILAAQPLEWHDLLHPETVLEKGAYQLGQGAPTMAAGIAGGLAGGAAGAAIPVAGETGVPEAAGALAGGSLAAGVASGVQAMAPEFARQLRVHPDNPDMAFDAALKRAAASGVISGVGWAAFNWAPGPFKEGVKHLLFQAFGVQPAVSMGARAVQNIAEGKPVMQGVGAEYLPSALGTAIPMAGHEALARLSAQAEPTPGVGEPAPQEQPAAPPGAPPAYSRKGAVIGGLAGAAVTGGSPVGAVVGAGVGAVAPRVVGAAGRMAAVPFNGFKTYLPRFFPQAADEAAVREIAGRVGQDERGGGIGLPEMRQQFASAPGKPQALVDVGGENLLGLAGNLGRAPGQAREVARNFFARRDAEAGTRLIGDIDREVSSGIPAQQAIEYQMDERAQKAAPLYDRGYNAPPLPAEAFAEGSPLYSLLQRPSMRLAAARAFRLAAEEGRNPRELGIEDEEGDLDPPLSWQTLDYIKRGLDDVVESNYHEDPLSRRLRLNTEGRAADATRRQFLQYLNDNNSDLAAARQIWAGHSRAMEMIRLGQRFHRLAPEELANTMRGLSEGDRDFFLLGAADTMRSDVLRTAINGDESKRLINSEQNRRLLRPLFPSEEAFQRFADAVAAERRMFDTRTQLMGNSATARRMAEDMYEKPSVLGGLAKGIIGGVALHGEPLFGARIGLEGAHQAWKALTVPNETVRAAMARRLFSDDPELNADTLARIEAINGRVERPLRGEHARSTAVPQEPPQAPPAAEPPQAPPVPRLPGPRPLLPAPAWMRGAASPEAGAGTEAAGIGQVEAAQEEERGRRRHAAEVIHLPGPPEPAPPTEEAAEPPENRVEEALETARPEEQPPEELKEAVNAGFSPGSRDAGLRPPGQENRPPEQPGAGGGPEPGGEVGHPPRGLRGPEGGEGVPQEPGAAPARPPEGVAPPQPAPEAPAANEPRVIEGKHTKTGAPIVTVQVPQKVGTPEFKALGPQARKLGGYYSAYRGNGALPGFIFKDRASADRFAAIARGEQPAPEAPPPAGGNAPPPAPRPSGPERVGPPAGVNAEEWRLRNEIAKAREETEDNPTDGQIRAGNYPKGRVHLAQGLDFVMENPEGSVRRGVDEDGEPWEVRLPADYGYLSRSEGADGDHVDAYLGPEPTAPTAYVIDQMNPDTGAFDEHKVMLGFPSWFAARNAYFNGFSDERGPERIGNVTPMSRAELKDWLREGDTKNPVGQQELPLGKGAKPPEPERPETPEKETPPSVPTPAASNYQITLANMVSEALANQEAHGLPPISARELQGWAEHVYGARLAEGRFTRDDIYNALELGVNKFIKDHPERFDPTVPLPRAEEIARDLENIKKNLPTQTVRAGEKDTFQQFSTPPDYSYAAAWIANIRPEDSVLEPSAGTGSLVAPAMNAHPREVITNEIDPKRAALVESLGPDGAFHEDGEQLSHILRDRVQPSVVLMNPPFSAAGERMPGRRLLDVGARHLTQGLQLLQPGGRLVAIVGRGMSMDAPTFRGWWRDVLNRYEVRANVGVPGDVYTKYGTSFGTRLLVIDNNPPSGREPVVADAIDIPDLMNRLAEVRNDRINRNAPGQPLAPQPGRQEAPPASGRAPRPALPVPPATPESGVREGAGDTGPGTAFPGRPGAGGGATLQPPAEAGADHALAPQQPERPGAGGAERYPPAGAPEGAGLGGGGPEPHGVVLRPEGVAGPLPAPGATPPSLEAAPEAVRVDEAAAEPQQGDITESVYEPYRPQRIAIAGAKPHPGNLVQSAAMASVMPPQVDYAPRLPPALIHTGALSDAQLEAITYAGHAHSQTLPAGEGETAYRRGYFIGDGCVAAGTRIYDPVNNRQVPIEDLVGRQSWVLSLTREGFRPYRATRIFRKGVAALFRVGLDDGRSIIVTDQHRFLTPEGWRHLGALDVGDALAVTDINDATDRAIHGEGAQNASKIIPGSTDRYSSDCHLCDAQPPLEADSVQRFSPSPTDVLGHNHLWLREDGLGLSSFDNDPGQSDALLSRKSSSPRKILFHALTSIPIGETPALSSEEIRQSDRQFPSVTAFRARSSQSGLDLQSAHASDLSRLYCEFEPHASEVNPKWSGTLHCNEAPERWYALPPSKLRQPRDVRLEESIFLAFSSPNNSIWAIISSIEFVGFDEFFDMYVPGPENYVAEGFVNHNTGVGKGREVAGIMLDNWMQGRRKAVWISEKKPLINDAKRDWKGLGRDPQQIFDFSKTKPGTELKAPEGIAFTTYDTLKSAERMGKDEAGKTIKGKTRIDQLADWLGKDFDGVIAFDESHNLANSLQVKGSRGTKEAAQKALAGIELQNKLPNARVVYVSATGATEVSNLAYAERLGLWGRGTAFPTKAAFINEVSGGGIAAMELVARDMKAMGSYTARNLSYDGVEYDRLEHPLTPEQREVYDTLAEAWQVTLNNFNKALELTGGKDDSKAKSAAASAFWGAHQRFFNQIITAMQMPSVIRGVEEDLKEGRQSVLQLVNTNEASQERALAKVENPEDVEDLDMTPRDQLMQLVEHSFPVAQHETYVDDDGNIRSRPVTDSNGNVVENKDAVALREWLLDKLGAIRVPEGPLEMLLNHFGADKVAEVTGRKQRVVRKPDENGNMRTFVENRPGAANITEADAFQGAKKPILVFSEAGGTGRSYHAENGTPSAEARRSHYLVQAGWRADKAIQGFGRTHRTNQASAPIFHLVTTDLQGQRRFISSIARRLSQLGALTKGERRTGDQGMFSARDNLESPEASKALYSFFRDLAMGRVPEIGIDDFEQQTGLRLRDDQGNLKRELPPITQFLNRLLSLKFDLQNSVFGAFEHRLSDAVDQAAAAGTLDAGTETLRGDRITKDAEKVVHTDPQSGAESKYVRLKVENKNHPVSFDDILEGRSLTGGRKPQAFVENKQSGKVYAVSESAPKTDPKSGQVTEQYRLSDPLGWHFIPRDAMRAERWNRLDGEAAAREVWEKQVAATPEYSRKFVHLITGAILPIWDRLKGSPKVFRTQTQDGERLLGRVIPEDSVQQTLHNLGAESAMRQFTPPEIAARIMDGDRAHLANGWSLKRSLVAGQPRIELMGPDYYDRQQLENDGVFVERIGYTTRFFVPTGEDAPKVLSRILERRPVTGFSGAQEG